MTDQNKAQEALENAIFETFEEMAFEQIFKEGEIDVEEDELEEEIEYIWSHISFFEPFEGSIFIQMYLKCAESLTRTVHGLFEDDDLNPSLVVDVMGEIANTIVGRFLSLLLSDEELFKMGLPETGYEQYPKLEEATHTLKYILYYKHLIVGLTGVSIEQLNQVNNNGPEVSP